jgi:hypothetical protein|tara:strand:+ start:175 stop:555 length:381 start_codon:yes stop_codon:yes gene_type:complete
LHSISKGKIGELAIRKDLIEAGYNIYLPECDSAQVDLVVELESGLMKRVQIKSVYSDRAKTSIEVNTKKYVNTGRVDIIAVYYDEMIAYVPYDNQKTLQLAISTAKNGQTKDRHWFYGYKRFPEYS